MHHFPYNFINFLLTEVNYTMPFPDYQVIQNYITNFASFIVYYISNHQLGEMI